MRFNYAHDNTLGMMPYYRNTYDLGKIYKIISPSTDKVYIGSTTLTLRLRLQMHEGSYRRYLKGHGGKNEAYDIIKLNDYRIEPIEYYPCRNRTELEAREGYWIKELNCINKNIAGRTVKQYYQDNIVQIKEFRRQRYNCDCGGKYTYENKYIHKKSKKHCLWWEAKIN